jgi:hypothetical protein
MTFTGLIVRRSGLIFCRNFGWACAKNIPQGLKPCIDLIRLMRQFKLPPTLKTSFSAACEAVPFQNGGFG